MNSLPTTFPDTRQGCSGSTEYVDSVVNDYFTRFPWNLSLKEDPPPGLTLDMPIDEDLTEEEKLRKGAVIAKMKKASCVKLHLYFPDNLFSLSIHGWTIRQKSTTRP